MRSNNLRRATGAEKGSGVEGRGLKREGGGGRKSWRVVEMAR